MNKVLLYQSIEAENAIAALFNNGSPVLVEVRFPRQGTSPDWYLCDEGQWEQLLERLGPGVDCISIVFGISRAQGRFA